MISQSSLKLNLTPATDCTNNFQNESMSHINRSISINNDNSNEKDKRIQTRSRNDTENYPN